MTARISSVFWAISGRAGKDPAVVEASITIDTSLWSSRKRNIVTRALRSDTSDCGMNTRDLVKDLSRRVARVEPKNSTCVHAWWDEVREDKRDELLAYTCAWMRIEQANHKADPARGFFYSPHYWFLERVEKGIPLRSIPAPKGADEDFFEPYLIERTEEEWARLHELADRIENGERITINAS